MRLFKKFFGAGKKHQDQTVERTKATPKSKYWKCPRCETLLKKGLGMLSKRVVGVGTCSNCGAQFPQSEIYGGSYDIFLELVPS